MEHEILGKSNLRVSRLCIGSWQASGWKSSNDAGFVRTLRHAVDRGLNFIDTAIGYGDGHAEQLIGAAVKGHRDRLVIASKFWHRDSNPRRLRKSLEMSLENLGTDYIDLYQQHWPPKKPALDVTLEELVKLKEEGKIRSIGVSNWMEPEFHEVKSLSCIDTLQPCYSLLWRSIEENVLPLCLKNRISILPYSPLCQGLLTGRFRSLDSVPDDHRKRNRLFSKEQFPDVLKVLDALNGVSRKHEKTPAQVALRWLLDREGVSSVIVGASSPKQVDENLGALGWNLDDASIEALNEVSLPLSRGLKAHDSLWNFHPRN